eukprot:TRINITY_DN20007_c0_g1_i1.p1 TRINITY_DN20007_c0_g1~~TRINITY_DN20007_c0_g1_i1.p1  ORF type:complete len:486 (+),score=72.58 TRINITY_DN20007_c0_g1_i1:73-1530(+)
MSLLPESVKIVAEELGVAALGDEVAQALAPDVEYRLRELVQGAIKFMRHSKRRHLTVADVNEALRYSHVESLYGHTSRAPLRFLKVPPHHDIFVVEDKELDVKDVVPTLLPNPLQLCYFNAEYLSVEGIEIPIGPNGIPEAPVEEKKRKTAADHGKSRAPSKNPQQSESAKFVDILIQAIREPIIKVPRSQVGHDFVQHEKSTAVIPTETKAKDEMELVDARNPLFTQAIDVISTSARIQPVIATLVQFINDEIVRSLGKLPQLQSAMTVLESLFNNRYIFLDPYVQQLVPATLTCLIGRNLCEKPTDDHWSLRNRACRLLCIICQRYGHVNRQMRPRIVKTLFHTLMDPLRPLRTHYGALSVLGKLDVNTIKYLIFPNLRTLHDIIEPNLEHSNCARRFEAIKAHSLLSSVCASYFRNHRSVTTPSDADRQSQGESFPTGLESELMSRVLVLDDQSIYNLSAEMFGDSFIAQVKNVSRLQEILL